jgi:chlorophyll(ide) b reductase
MCFVVMPRINNAGSNGYKYKTLAESSDADLINIVETNVLGTMLGCKEVSHLLL